MDYEILSNTGYLDLRPNVIENGMHFTVFLQEYAIEFCFVITYGWWLFDAYFKHIKLFPSK